ncbi:MAG: HesA/MoeB/ThiF family protein [Thaumarchaeota archaeon]|nr:HesA/MoeB/ThiF family protein [Nitrososphaerota archaeon]
MSIDDRYFARQLVLDGFGRSSQERLARSKVLIAGLGGTGSLMAVHLALAGVGRLTLVDRDVVSFENLHRQPIYAMDDVGKSKAEVAAKFVSDRVPRLKVAYRTESIDQRNSLDLLGNADLAVDCLDSMDGRRALNSSCVERKKPFVHTGAIGWEVSEAVLWPGRTACFECLFPPVAQTHGEYEDLPSCDQVGTLGPVVAMAASLGATDAIKVLATQERVTLGRMTVWDGRSGEIHRVDIKRRSDCAACGTHSARAVKNPQSQIGKSRVIELCGGREYYVTNILSPAHFADAGRRFLARGAEMRGESIVHIRVGEVEVSLFRAGGAVVRGVPSAREAAKVIKELGLEGAEVRFATGNA